MAAAMAAVSAALYGFTVFLIFYHASDCQPNGRSYDYQYDSCSHRNLQSLFNLFMI